MFSLPLSLSLSWPIYIFIYSSSVLSVSLSHTHTHTYTHIHNIHIRTPNTHTYTCISTFIYLFIYVFIYLFILFLIPFTFLLIAIFAAPPPSAFFFFFIFAHSTPPHWLRNRHNKRKKNYRVQRKSEMNKETKRRNFNCLKDWTFLRQSIPKFLARRGIKTTKDFLSLISERRTGLSPFDIFTIPVLFIHFYESSLISISACFLLLFQ